MRYIETAVDMLRPGGYLEMQELEGRWSIKGDAIGEDWEWVKPYYAALQAKGLDPYCVEKLDGWMRGAGVQSVRVESFKWPLTGGQKETY